MAPYYINWHISSYMIFVSVGSKLDLKQVLLMKKEYDLLIIFRFLIDLIKVLVWIGN